MRRKRREGEWVNRASRTQMAPLKKPTISDSYITSRDGGLRYAYRASWFRDGTHLYWRAKVKRDDALKGLPAGKVGGFSVGSEEIAVRSLVENAIEVRAGVEK